MVTHWSSNWDRLPNNETRFSKKMLKRGVSVDKIREDTPTIFIKKNEQTKRPGRAWERSVYGFRVKEHSIYFKVKINREISVPSAYMDYQEGWYAESIEEEVPLKALNYPLFFYILSMTNDYNEFEKYVYSLLKLLGIHQIFRCERQRGQPDGFFKLGNLAVVYDATLEDAFERVKEAQMDNYCSQLRTGRLTHVNRVIDVSSCSKQVWIITRGIPRVLKRVDDVTVKEVTIIELIKVYSDRVEKDMDEAELEAVLRDICADSVWKYQH